MTPFRSPFQPTVPSPWARRHHLGATQQPSAPRPDAPDPWATWVQTGANVFRAVGVDTAKIWNSLFPDSQVSVPGVGGAASAVGVGQSAYDIARRGPTVQNVSGVTLGSARTVQAGAQLFGESGSATTGAIGVIGPVVSVIGLGLSAWQVATQPTPVAASGLAVSAAATTGYAATALGAESIGALASIATPMTAVVAIPFIVGAITAPILRAAGLTAAGVHWPAGYIQLPDGAGDVISAVDPASGRVLTYDTQRGKYAWSDQTLDGIAATPAQFTAWGVQPTGKLARVPGYDQIEHFRDEWVMATLRGDAPSTFHPVAGTPAELTQSYLMEQRQPTITALHEADPGASPGEIWRQYTLTPEYQQEQPIAAALNPGPIEHGGGGQ